MRTSKAPATSFIRAEADAAMQPLANILDRVSDAFVALDKNWYYTYVNQQAASLFGRRPEDLIGRHIWTEFPEGRGQPFHLAYEKAMAEQIFIQMENYYEPWNRWFENRIYPSPEGLSIFFHEITERKLAEQAAHENAQLLAGQNQVLEIIARGAPLHESLDALLRVIEAQCPGMQGSILLLDPDGIHVRHGAAPSLPQSFIRAIDGQPIGANAGSCGTAAFRREPVVVEDIATDPLWKDYRTGALAHGLRACWSTPIFDGQRNVLGTFALYFRTPGRPTGRHRRLVDLSTHTAAIAIVKHRETQALLASEERQRLAASSGHIGLWEWNIGTDRVLWSDELKAIFGWPPERDDLTFEMVVDAIHPDDRTRIDRAVRRALAERSTYDEEYRIVRPGGSVRWIAGKGRCEYDAAGVPERMMGVALDITDRKRAEEELWRRQAQLADAQRIAHLGSYEWEVESNTVHRSEELCRIFGVPRDQFPPTFEGYLERVHPDDRSTTRATIETAFRTGMSFEFEERIIRPDGTVRMLHSQGTWMLNSGGRPVRLVGICQDITERKKSQELEREINQRKLAEELLRARNEELKAFAYTVSHDLKAPLRGIAGYAAELDRRHRSGLSERAVHCLKQILTATHNLDRLIEDLLHYARLDAETTSVAHVNLAEMIEAILRDRHTTILSQNAEVTLDLGVTSVRTWERGLFQALTNLIDNALKYSREARPSSIRIASQELAGAFLLVIADNGIGFDMKYHDRIFGLFDRLVRQEEFEGTGAGLAIVKKIVDKMGGRIWAESAPGAGATFYVEWPQRPAVGSGD
jgi:PAS domain S-box-containing protein